MSISRLKPAAATLIPLLAGLSLGSGAVVTWRHISDTASPAGEPRHATAVSSARSSTAPEISLVAPRLPEAEADAALDAYLALPPLAPDAATAEIHVRFSRLRALLTLLPVSRFERLFAALAVRTGDPEARCRRIAFAVWTELDAPAAARWALAVVPGEAINEWARSSYLQLAAKAWAEADFDAAYAWASTLPDASLARALAGSLLATLATADPVRAVTLARARGDEFFNANRETLFITWADKDPAAALRALGADLLAKKIDPRGVAQAIVKWLGRDPTAAFAWMQSQTDDGQDRSMSLLEHVVREASFRPENASAVADLLVAHPELPGQISNLRNLTVNWGRKDQEGLFAWLKDQPAGETKSRLVETCLPFLRSDNFFDALLLLPAGPDRQKRLADRLANWAGADPEAALAWISAHPSPEVATASAKIEGAIISHLARSDPAAAFARWQAMPASPERSAAVGPIALAWAKTDPAAALHFLADEAARPAAVFADNNDPSWATTTQSIAWLLARQDSASFLRLANTLPASDVRSNIYLALANDHDFDADDQALAPLPHQARADLLAGIPDPENRAMSLNVLLKNWLRRDYDAARAWIETHDVLPAEAAAKLLDANSPDKVVLF